MLVPNAFAAVAVLSTLVAALPLPANDAAMLQLSERSAQPTIVTEVDDEGLLSKRAFKWPWAKIPAGPVYGPKPRPAHALGAPLPLYARPPNPGNPKYFPEKKKYAPGLGLGLPANAPALPPLPVKAAPVKRGEVVANEDTETLAARGFSSMVKLAVAKINPPKPPPRPYGGYRQTKGAVPTWNSKGAYGKREAADEDTETLAARGLGTAVKAAVVKLSPVKKEPPHPYRGYIQVKGAHPTWNSKGAMGKRTVADEDTNALLE